MFKWFTLGLAAMAALFLTNRMIWASEEMRLAAADHVDTQTLDISKSMSKHVAALEAAAELGVLDAQLKLARMYESGDGMPLSHEKAFDLYRRIADDHADVRQHHARVRDVSHAFVALGGYYRVGIPGSAIQIDKQRAASLLWHAASYLGDAEAQCDLAQMYLEGEGVPKNGRLAVNWLTNAAKKRHGKAQALLGDLLWSGAKDVRRQPHKGLALLSLARQNARDKYQARWIDDLYADAYAQALAEQRVHAEKLAVRWQAHLGRKGYIVIIPEQANAAEAAASEAGTLPDTAVAAGFTTIGMDGASALR
jgi:hypothetical protein